MKRIIPVLPGSKINLAWHQVTSEAASSAFDQTMEEVKGVNVISPTWFSVTWRRGCHFFLASADMWTRLMQKA